MAYTTINKHTDYFNTKLYTGNGSAGHAITGVGFQPDWVWYKGRNDTEDPKIFDAVRGVTKAIKPNGTDTEFTQSGVTSFDSDGFTLGSHTGGNENNINFVAWNWKANGQGSSNSDGSITSTVSANTTAGFSIVSYTGTGSVATVGHGLGVAPKLIIVKRLSGGTEAWPVDCRAASGIMYLNETGSLGSYGNSSPFPSTAPTTTVFSIGTANNANASGSPFIAYCFAEKTGYSKIGQYRGNGNNDGAFVYTGFRPEFTLIKPSSASQNWQIHDTKRDGYNVKNDNLAPNNNAAEADNQFMDILSNGFKLRSSTYSASSTSYVYLAFGQSLVGSNNIPCTAR